MTPNKQNTILTIIALILVTVVLAFLVARFEQHLLAKIDSMSPEDYIKHQRHLYQHGYLYHFMTYLILGGIYIGIINFIVCAIGLFIPKKPNA